MTLPYFSVLAGAPGQGKTNTVLDVYAELQATMANPSVGGFCLRPVYGPHGGRFRLIGYDALVFSTKETFPLARLDRPDWEHIQIGSVATEHAFPEGKLCLDIAAADRLLAAVTQQAEDATYDAFLIDDVGPVLASRINRKKVDDRKFLEDLVVSLAHHPKKVNLVVFSDCGLWNVVACRRALENHRVPIAAGAARKSINSTLFRSVALEVNREIAHHLLGRSSPVQL